MSGGADRPIRVVVVDDQTLVRSGLVAILSTDDGIDVIGDAADGAQAVERCRHLRPDVVLMDIRMPVMDGVEATRRLAGAGVVDPLRVLVLTTFVLDEYVYASLLAGASGFLLKDAPADELLHAIRVVASGDALLAPSVTKRLISEFARQAQLPAVDGEVTRALARLTEREREVLLLMARGMSNAEIAAAMIVGETTVKTHVGRILTKLAVRDRVHAVVLAYESGLVVPGHG